MATTSQPTVIRRRIQVRGVVQGVGFRPYVYQLAHRFQLTGFVLNSSSGVTIEIEGPEAVLELFVTELLQSPPALAHIESFESEEVDSADDSTFCIRDSTSLVGEFVLISPDVATCSACWSDTLASGNRRHAYPFTNCTNCGPRYTIVRDIPYDRPNTTMADFRMCTECQAEYDDPGDRRFHAQPNACAVCGPSVVLVETGSAFPNPEAYKTGSSAIALFHQVRQALRAGKIITIKGLGGFQLACDAENEAAVRELRRRKKRSDKPFALMARDMAVIEEFCVVTAADQELLGSPEHPIVILQRRAQAKIVDEVAPQNKTLGVMLPYTPLQFFLFSESPSEAPEFTALVMTSGNISEEPIVVDNREAWERLAPVADAFLLHNRDIYMRVDDSVVRTFEGRPRVLRRSRGYVPQPIDLGMPVVELLACGAELKNTFCLTKDRYAILSQHIGDLENYETLQFFEETLENLKKLFRVEPQAVAYDLHPLYISSQYAKRLSQLPSIGVQHHHAHIASCMAENGIREKAIGVAFDGTGYGTDGTIWGGEFLIADFAGFERRAHFRNIPLPGGDAAIREPWRAAVSYLRETFGSRLPDLPFWEDVPEKRVSLISAMLERNINTVPTSSCGRLFDAVASLIGLRQEVNFEGQAAIELEAIAESGVDNVYEFAIENVEPLQIDMRPAIRAMVEDVRRGGAAGSIASTFHNTIAVVTVEVCERIRKLDGISRVCLSGGTFQNIYLLGRAVESLRNRGFEVFLHEKVPPNDGGISLGQAVIASELLRRGA